jgi:cardiolipin synthase
MKYVLALVIVAACGGSNSDSTIDAAPDARDPATCVATSPRTAATQTFIGPEGLQTRLDALIDSAQSTLDVQMYLFTVKDLAMRIANAKARGVTVRVILDPDEAGNQTVEPTLTNGGVAWKNASSVYMFSHAKYLIIDHTQGVIMSMNFNTDAMVNERNYGLVTTDAGDIGDLQKIFDYDWALANGQQATAPDLSCTRLIVSPVNAAQRLNELIASAKSTLDVEVLYVTDTTLRNAIGKAKQNGANVRVILETDQDQPENAATMTYFKGLGIPVKYATTQFYLHAKLIVADGVAFVGSENLSYTSQMSNREVGTLVSLPEELQPITGQFEADWNATVAQ